MTEFEKIKELAEQGDADAQNRLGLRYYFGQGVRKDYAKAVRWWTKSAEQGNPYAQNNLGVCYYRGEGVEKNKAEAVRLCTKAAEQGNTYAQDLLDKLTKEMEIKND